jgi:hypothetical protein
VQKGLFIFITCVCLSHTLLGQRKVEIEGDKGDANRVGSSVLDDTTKQIYGPTTTRYTYENNIKYNNSNWHNIDTAVFDFHKYQFIAKTNNTYQDLGNIGMAMMPIYPGSPDIIGARLGFDIYDIYYTGPEEVKIYDTKSPYSKFGIIWGGRGRSVTEAAYTRNIDERSNISFEYKGLFIDKQIERDRRGDRQVLGTNYSFGGNYGTKNGRYFISGNFTRNRQVVDEYGGVLLGADSSLNVYFKDNRQANLSDTETIELRTNYHVYQQFKFNDILQIYHVYDRNKQFNDFNNAVASEVEANADYYNQVALDSLPVRDRTKMIYRQHEVGIKGDIGKTFYSVYYKGREVNVDYKYLEEGSLDYGTYYMENYVGAVMRFGNDSTSFINTYAEYLPASENYKIGARIQNKWFFAEGRSSRYLPTYVQRAYLSRHDSWLNSFESTINTKIESGLNLKVGNLTVSPKAGYNLITDYVYFTKLNLSDTLIRPYQPVQASGDISIITGEINIGLKLLKHFTLKTQFIYAEVAGSSSEAIKLPRYLLNGQLAYYNILYDGNLQLQLGVDFHQRSAYFANAYDPSIMQYYVQDEFEMASFPVIDVFVNMKINRGRVFLKLNNLYEMIKGTGYFLTPQYPAQNTILDFGIDWALYD